MGSRVNYVRILLLSRKSECICDGRVRLRQHGDGCDVIYCYLLHHIMNFEIISIFGPKFATENNANIPTYCMGELGVQYWP